MTRIITASADATPGVESGLFVTNYPVEGFLSHDRLSALRPDLVTVRVMGQANGGPALDYTVNCAIGFPQITGPAELGDQPVNHVLAAWDLLTGAYAAFTLLAAREHRLRSGQGQEVRVPLADVGIGTVANLGMLAEVLSTGDNRQRLGNDVYKAFGRDFLTADGKRLMIMAITPRQWKGLVQVLGIESEIAAIEAERGVSFAKDEGIRFDHRDALYPLVTAKVVARHSGELGQAFDAAGCCWGPYQSMYEAAHDPALVTENPIFSVIRQASGVEYPVAGSMATLTGLPRQPPVRGPHLGEHTDEVLAELLGMASGEIGALHDKGLVAGV